MYRVGRRQGRRSCWNRMMATPSRGNGCVGHKYLYTHVWKFPVYTPIAYQNIPVINISLHVPIVPLLVSLKVSDFSTESFCSHLKYCP